jgi:hypothetical protein
MNQHHHEKSLGQPVQLDPAAHQRSQLLEVLDVPSDDSGIRRKGET